MALTLYYQTKSEYVLNINQTQFSLIDLLRKIKLCDSEREYDSMYFSGVSGINVSSKNSTDIFERKESHKDL
jgi:hypothetical protein